MLKIAKKAGKTLMNFKVTLEERKMIENNAKKYASGNVSLWLRYASTQLEPKQTDLDHK